MNKHCVFRCDYKFYLNLSFLVTLHLLFTSIQQISKPNRFIQPKFSSSQGRKIFHSGKIKNIQNKKWLTYGWKPQDRDEKQILCSHEGLQYYNINFNFTMNLFEDLDAKLNENSLDVMLGLSPSASEGNECLGMLSNICPEKQNCVTYQWIWNDEEPMQQVSQPTQDIAIDEMKSARAEQEAKVRQFIANIKPITILQRKASLQAQTEAGSPKKKKIRKMLSFK